MAIEAANQMADPNRVVVGFELRDVLFHKALHVPDDSDGIETNFYLRQMPDASGASVSWSEFRLCSFEDGNWCEHCRGSIRVGYHMSPGAVDGGREFLEDLKQCRQLNDKLSRSCTEDFDSNQLYKSMRDCGYGFGQSFQRLRNGSSSTTNEARSDIMLYHWPINEYPQPHIVHPTTLDAILHLSVAASTCGGQKSVSTAVPTMLRKMAIAKSGLSHPGNVSVKAAAWMTAVDTRGTEFDMSVLDTSKNNVLARVEGLRSTTIADPAGLPLNATPRRQICYHLESKPDIDLIDRKQLTAYCKQARDLRPEPVQFYQDLTFLLFMFLSRSIEAIGVTEVKGLQPHLQRYIDWAKLQLDRYHKGELPYSKPGWESLLRDHRFIESLCDAVGTTNDQGRVFVATGRNLTSILRGEVDPLDFLFKNDLLRDLYREVNGSRTCFPEFARYLDALGHKNPSMRILEVGAGTGGTTGKILSTLAARGDAESGKPKYSSYQFTDISPSFFEQGRDDFQEYPNITFTTLDIEADPSLQGYEAEAYDLVVAANVLHATKDINSTMRHVRKLLKPGGKLMMYELTQPNILRTGFVAGLMSGWWLGTENFRQWNPSLTSELWEKVLLENDFSGLDLELPDFVSPECHEASVLVTTAISATPTIPAHDRTILIANPHSDLQVNVAQHTVATIQSEQNHDCQVLSLDEATAATDKGNTTVIFFEELEQPLLWDLSSGTYSALQGLLASSTAVLWVSAGGGISSKRPEFALVNGLSRALRNENPERPLVTLALDIQGGVTEKQLRHIRDVFRITQLSFQSPNYEPEYVEIDGLLNIPRVVPDSQLSQELFWRSIPRQSTKQTVQNSPPLKLAIESPGLLDTLHFVEDDDYRCSLAPDEVEVEVRAIGMNFRDCLMALGRIPGSSFGSECAGVVTRVGERCVLLPGDRVVMSAAETFKTFSRGKAHHVFKINEGMTFLEAASIPAQFGTAWQAVNELARLRAGETILIHAGAGGTGQAAVQVSQYLSGEVFATVGSEAKKHVLMDEYGIPEDHIFYSRDTTFAKGVMRMTKGRGVDVIINSLAGDGLVASWECIAPYGRFVEIGKKDILSNSNLPMYPFRNNATFASFDGFPWQRDRPLQAKECLQSVFDLFARGKLHTVRPLHAFSISKTEEAFRLMQDGKAAGKIVMEITPDCHVSVSHFAVRLNVQATNLWFEDNAFDETQLSNGWK